MPEVFPLLGPDDPPAYSVHGPGHSPFVLVADHAGQQVPAALGDLGVAAADRARHIGWDIGIAGVTVQLAERLQGWAILQRYSRLVIDCNRPPGAAGSIVEASDGIVIPGNRGLPPAQVQARQDEVFSPYHRGIAAELDRRAAAGRPAVLVAMHSFTPALGGIARPWQAGVLYQRDRRLAAYMLEALAAKGWVVGDNQPYAVSDATDYAIPVHGERRGLLHVELEIRQDLIVEDAGQRQWADLLARILQAMPATLAED